MDVGEQQLPHIGDRNALVLQREPQRLDRSRGSRIDERHAISATQDGGGDDVRPAEEQQIDIIEPRGERLDHCALPAVGEDGPPL